MAAAIKDRFQVESELIKGSSGVFDVKVDDALIYSKQETGVFPEHHEVLDKLTASA